MAGASGIALAGAPPPAAASKLLAAPPAGDARPSGKLPIPSPSSAVPSSSAEPTQRCHSELDSSEGLESLESLEEALEAAKRCAVEEEDGQGNWGDNTFKQSLKLRSYLRLAAEPDYNLPPGFKEAMETCMDCMLHAPIGHLLHGRRMLELLDSSEFGPVMRYLEWLQKELRGVIPGHGSSSSSQSVPVPGRVRHVVHSWSAELSLLRQSAAVLCDALLTHGREHLRRITEWHEAEERRNQIRTEEQEFCARASRDLEDSVTSLVNRLASSSGAEWPTLAHISESSLRDLQKLTTELLGSREDSRSKALEEYEALAARANSCQRIVLEERHQVRKHELDFKQAAQRFAEAAGQLLAWLGVLLPKLRLLRSSCMDLSVAVELHGSVPELEREYMAAEDELDEAESELRKHQRHSKPSRTLRMGRSFATDAALEALRRQCELRVAGARERARLASERLQAAESRLQAAEGALPLALDPAGLARPAGGELRLTPAERLARKLAALEQLEEDAAVQVSELLADSEGASELASEQGVDRLLWKQVEPDFMCPILHERMTEPVLAADGHTYERGAIEKWLQRGNTSPMTGAPLPHRYLTENFALRRLIAAHDAGAERGREEDEDGQCESACEESAGASSCGSGEEEAELSEAGSEEEEGSVASSGSSGKAW